jgi:hypothetical protein
MDRIKEGAITVITDVNEKLGGEVTASIEQDGGGAAFVKLKVSAEVSVAVFQAKRRTKEGYRKADSRSFFPLVRVNQRFINQRFVVRLRGKIIKSNISGYFLR